MFNKTVMLCLFIVLALISHSQAAPSNTVKTNDIIDKMTPEELAGQLLMIGIPADSGNYIQNPLLNEAIKDLRIGGFIINNYHLKSLPDKYAVQQSVIALTNYMQNMASSQGIPLFISADFESIRYSSLKKALIHHPSFLTLGATQNATLVSQAGNMAGQQLMGVGINMLLGPVLDVNKTDHGQKSYPNITTRSFGGSEKIVHQFAANYLSGIKKTKILTIAKHFPDIGHASTNPHRDACPEFQGSLSDLQKQLTLYSKLKNNIDGVMTSHQYISINSWSQDVLVTFSQNIVSNLLQSNSTVSLNNKEKIFGINFRNKLMVSDDLSSMKAIQEYKKNTSKNFGEIAVEAFDAGHDILLFSHIGTASRKSSKNSFPFNSIRMVHKALTNHIKQSPQNLAKAKKSVAKIINKKLSLNSTYKTTMTSNMFNRWERGLPEQLNKFLKTNNYTSTKEYINKSLEEGTLIFQKNVGSLILKDRPTESTIAIFSADNGFIEQSTHLENKSNIHINHIKIRNRRAFNKYRKQILRTLRTADMVIIVVDSIDTANLADSVLRHKKLAKEKVIIFLHDTPKTLSLQTIQNTTVIGNFSRLKEAYKIDHEILLGHFTPHHFIGRLTISLPPYYEINVQDFKILTQNNHTAPRIKSTTKTSQDTTNLDNNFVQIYLAVLAFIFISIFFGMKTLCPTPTSKHHSFAKIIIAILFILTTYVFFYNATGDKWILFKLYQDVKNGDGTYTTKTIESSLSLNYLPKEKP